MHDATTAPRPTRDNLLGICHRIGATFGFDPLYLRLALMVGMLVDFEWTVIAYAVAGLAVLASVMLAPGPRRARA